MSLGEALIKITPVPFLSVLIWILLSLSAMYFARKPFHRTIRSFGRIINNAMRLSSASVLKAEETLQKRNKEVLMTEGLQESERIVEREFSRINTAIQRDLERYPVLHRQMSDIIKNLEEDHSKSVDSPPSLPDWTKLIETIAQIKHSGDSMVSNMLMEINRTLTDQHKTSIEDYRNSSAKRHQLLARMLPLWRHVEKVLTDIGDSIKNLSDRTKIVDRYMKEYQEIRAKTDKAERKLSSSSLTQFFIAGLVLCIAIGGAIINFNLIALPMSEMVGGGSYIGPYKTSDVAGLVIILIELSTGLFLLESLRITHLFPIISSMDDRMRGRMIWITLTILTVLAGVESALAFMRDQIASDMEALRQSLAGVEGASQVTSMIPMLGQMVMGFVLPFALAFVAIPLESFVSSSRTVLGLMGMAFLRIVAFGLRLFGNICYYIGQSIINIYDLIIFPALWLETTIGERPQISLSEKREAKEKKEKISKIKKSSRTKSKNEELKEIVK